MYIFEINLFGINIAPTYYGLMYALSLLIGYFIFLRRGVFSKEKIEKLFFYMFAGIVFGGRFGYVLFYNFSYYLENPIKILNLTEGGMSFHGGLLGVLLAILIFSKIEKENFFKLGDELATVFPIGLFFGRIGNYINNELYGFSGYNGPFAMSINGENYFPSPLLEAFLEGIFLFIILNWIYRKKILKQGQLGALFLIFYGIFRIFVEIFFRLPDSQIGYIGGIFTMGSLLSLPMILVGLFLLFYLKNNEKS